MIEPKHRADVAANEAPLAADPAEGAVAAGREGAVGATPVRSVRYHALDIWRGIVCLVVVLEHTGVVLWSHWTDDPTVAKWAYAAIAKSLSLNLGAPLFFVISGYCIMASLDSTRRKGIAPIRFMARRIWRIFPPYWVSMAIIGVLVLVLDYAGWQWLYRTDVGLELFDPRQFRLDQWLGNVSLTETYRQVFVAGNEIHLLNRVAWALCYQEQFYLVCFLALVFCPRRLYKALGIATLAIVCLRTAAWDVGRDRYIVGLFPDLWHEFAVGLLLYWRINVARTWAEKRAAEAILVATALVGYQAGLVTTVAAASFGLILLLAHRWDEASVRVKQFDLLRACGRRSYSVYLIHLPVCTVGNSLLFAAGLTAPWARVFVILPVVTAASVIAGWVFYACVDSHFTNLPIVGRFGKWIKPRPRGMVLPHAQV